MSIGRAHDAPQVRRLFSWPQDPRFHMLEHLSSKFTMAPPKRELRAALIINRFTRSLSIMFATTSIAEVLGLEPGQLENKSFYECIQDNCLDDAMECIEAAKANDSIAYLRFWSRDARREDELSEDDGGIDGDLSGDTLGDSSGRDDGGQGSGSASANRDSTPRRNSSDSEQGGVRLDAGMDLDSPVMSASPIKREPMSREPEGASITMDGQGSSGSNSHHVSAAQSSASDTESVVHPVRRAGGSQARRQQSPPYPLPSVEIEAFISCTSDGLVVILRRARQLPTSAAGPSTESTRQGVFAAPWASQPVAAHYGPAAHHDPQAHHIPQAPSQHVPVQAQHAATGGPAVDQLMASIQEVAVFAWALVGINRTLGSYSHGNPTGHAQPAEEMYYNEKSPEHQMPPYGSSGDVNRTNAAPPPYYSNGFTVSDKGQPVEPRYTSYPEQGANQLRSNGPWSSGHTNNWRGQAQHPQGQQQPHAFNGNEGWGQGFNGQHDPNGAGNPYI